MTNPNPVTFLSWVLAGPSHKGKAKKHFHGFSFYRSPSPFSSIAFPRHAYNYTRSISTCLLLVLPQMLSQMGANTFVVAMATPVFSDDDLITTR
jgi:hypothetical protein